MVRYSDVATLVKDQLKNEHQSLSYDRLVVNVVGSKQIFRFSDHINVSYLHV